MLEQRRAKQKGFITLKEAAELSGYTADYVGQLIRGGKIQGEQVYSGVAWMITPDELSRYQESKGKQPAQSFHNKKSNSFSSRVDALSLALHKKFNSLRTFFLASLFVCLVVAIGLVVEQSHTYAESDYYSSQYHYE